MEIKLGYASTNQIGSKLIDEAIKKWPDMPSRTVARKLFDQNKGVWATVDTVRSSIRRRRGRNGVRNRSFKNPMVSNKSPSKCPSVPWVPDSYIPSSDEREFLPYVVTVEKDTRALVLSDIHIPYHTRDALKVALSHGKEEDCSMVIINGDLIDFHRLSRFQKDPRARSAKGEISKTNEFLDAIDELFPKARKIFKEGNHDERLNNYIRAHAEDVYDLVEKEITLEKLLELQDRGWEHVGDKRPMQLGGLTMLHGHEYPTPMIGPVNAARGLFLRTKASAIVGHHHQTSEHSETDVRGKLITTWSIACLCDLHPEYAVFNKWNHGLARIDLAKSGDFHVQNRRIIAGRLV